MKNMLIKTKLIISFILIGLTPFVYMGLTSYINSSKALEEKSYNQLVSIREIKKTEVLNYLNLLKNQILSTRKNDFVVDSTENFIDYFANIKEDLNLSDENLDEYKTKLNEYYKLDFNKKFLEINNENSNYTNYFNKLDEKGLILQYLYIKNNPNPLGSKDLLIKSTDNSSYSQLHEKIHPFLSDYLNRFGYYDIFIIDIDTGHIVYSVYKELDYATSLITGPYQNSNLAKAFTEAKKINNKEDIYVSDFETYYPSYNSPAGFIATPIFNKNNEKIGVLAFQFPIDELNRIMNQREGMGESGEAYLVGSDKLMRSDSYLDPVNHSVINSFKNTKLGAVDTVATTKGIKGETGEEVILDYNGNYVLSSYTPINFNNLKWVLLVEIDKKEVFSSITKFFRLFIISLITGTIIIFIISLIFGNRLSKELSVLSVNMKEVAEGEADLTKELEIVSMDEIGQVSAYYNKFIKKLLTIVLSTKNSAEKIKSETEEISKSMDNLVKGRESIHFGSLNERVEEGINQLESHVKEAMDKVRNQTASAEQVMASIEEISSTLTLTSQNVDRISENSENSVSLSSDGYESISKVNKQISLVSESVYDSSNEITSLLNLSEAIGNITTSITSISEQTNLLALNAAIEAARAGEAGRGFAVVAESIRNLAEESNKEASKITEIVSDIQKSINNVKGSNDKVNVNVKEAIEIMDITQNKIQEVISLINNNNKEIGDIKSSVREQSGAIHEISEAIQEITNDSTEIENVSLMNDEIAKELKDSLEKKLILLEELEKLSQILIKDISGFKTE